MEFNDQLSVETQTECQIVAEEAVCNLLDESTDYAGVESIKNAKDDQVVAKDDLKTDSKIKFEPLNTVNEAVAFKNVVETNGLYDQAAKTVDQPHVGKGPLIKVDLSDATGNPAIKNTNVTADNGIETEYRDGTKITKWENGVVRVTNADGTGYVRVPDIATGRGYDETHWGPKDKDNYTLRKAPDGNFLLHLKGMERETPLFDGQFDDIADKTDIRVQRSRMDEMAISKITDPDMLLKFRTNLRDFEARVGQFSLTEEKVAKTFDSILDMVANGNDKILDRKTRVVLAEQMLQNASHPESINQGYHNTCNVNTVEGRLNYRDPDKVANFVSELAKTGEFTSYLNDKIKLDKESLKPDREAKKYSLDHEGRNFASQIFQVGAVNLSYQIEKRLGNETHDIRYEQRRHFAGSDTGERLFDITNGRKREVRDSSGARARSPELSLSPIARLHNVLAENNDQDITLEYDKQDRNNENQQFKNKEELVEYLHTAKINGQLPVIVQVHTDHEPMYSIDVTETTGGTGGWHVFLVTDINGDKIDIDNSWGKKNDQKADVRNLFLSMVEPDSQDARDFIFNDVVYKEGVLGKADTYTELEMNRFDNYNSPRLTEKYAKDIIETMNRAQYRWNLEKADGTFDPAEQQRALKRYNELIKLFERQNRRLARKISRETNIP